MKIASKHPVFCMLSCQDTANTNVFSRFVRAGTNKNEEKTGIYDTLQAPCRKKHRKKTVFFAHSLKNLVNSGVLGDFRP